MMISVATVVALGVWVIIAVVSATILASGHDRIILVLVAVSPLAAIVAVGVATIMAPAAANFTTLPFIPSSVLVVGLGLALSPYRSLRLAFSLTPVLAVLFVASQGWTLAGLVSLLFLIGYFRLLLYPMALLATGAVVTWSHLGNTRINELIRRLLPPFADEIVWLPIFGLDKALVAAFEQNAEQGSETINYVAQSFRQEWAGHAARLQLAARTMARYQTIEQIVNAPHVLARLSTQASYERSLLRNMAEVSSRIEGIARQVEMALVATNDNVRRQRLHQARTGVNDLYETLTTLKRHTSQLFLPVAKRWERLIGDQIDRPPAEREQAYINNPYIPGIPVQLEEAAMFAPRSELVEAVKNVLNRVHDKPTLALYGAHGMGKSTFLMHLPRFLPDEVVPIFVSLQRAVQEAWSGGLYYHWVVATHKTIQKRCRLDLPYPVLADFGLKPAVAWQEWLDQVERVLEGRKLFFTFDEFECLVDAIEKNPVIEEAFSILGHLSQDWPHVHLLFSGTHRLEELAPAGRWHDYFINVHPLEVSYLDEAGAVRLLTSPIPDFSLDYEPGAVDEIINLTRSQPMLVQLMGSVLVNWHNSPSRRQQQDSRIVTLEDVAYAAEEILHEGRSYFVSLWADVEETGQRLLRPLTQKPIGMTRETLMRETGLSSDDLSAALAQLGKYQLIEQIEDHWRIQVELTRRVFAKLAHGKNTGNGEID